MNKKLRIAISAGHNVYVNGIFDPGAVKEPHTEANITRETVVILKSLLEKQGHTVIDVTPYEQKFTGKTGSIAKKSHHIYRCNKVDEFKADLFLDIHINSGGGFGVETWVYSKNSKSYPYAEEITNNISNKLNLRNRGTKVNPDYWSLSLCDTPAMIIEGAFIDNKEDMKKLTSKKYAISIAECFGKVKIEEKIDTDNLYKVQVGAFKSKKYAEELLDELKKAGFDGFINETKIENKEDKKEEVKEEKVEAPIVKEDNKLKLEYKGLIKNGSKGNNVKELQEILNKLDYNCGKADGIAGNNTITQIKNLQRDYGLVSDGIAGQATYNKINELLSGKLTSKPKTSVGKSKYYKKGNVHIIETTPNNIEIKILGDTLHNAGVWGVNGTFFDTPRPQLAKSCWAIATNNGKAIGGNSMLNSYNKSIKRGTLVYYKDGTMDIVRVNSINEFKKPHTWSIGGYSVYPYMNFKEEKMPNGINYKTAHTFLGIKDNKVFLMVKPNCMIKDIIPLAKEMKLEKILVVDGGGSSQLRHLDGSFKASRKINSAVLLKEV